MGLTSTCARKVFRNALPWLDNAATVRLYAPFFRHALSFLLPATGFVSRAIRSVGGFVCLAASSLSWGNDAWTEATPLRLGDAALVGSTVGATSQPGEQPTHRQNTVYAGSLWYKLVPGTVPVVGGNLVRVTAWADPQVAAAVAPSVAVYRRVGENLADWVWVAGQEEFAWADTVGDAFYVQVTGPSTAVASSFQIQLTAQGRGDVVLPFGSAWEHLMPPAGQNPNTDPAWPEKWRLPGDATAFLGSLAFSAASRTPIGYGGLDRPPGVATGLATPASGQRHAAYFRRTFTLSGETANLWAEIFADDAAYLFVDDFPPVPLFVAAGVTQGTAGNLGSNAFTNHFPQPPAHFTGNLTTPCRGVFPALSLPGVSSENNAFRVYLGGLLGKLGNGAAATTHRIAVSVHQSAANSSDMGFDLQLTTRKPRPWPVEGLRVSFTDAPHTPATGQANPYTTSHWAPWFRGSTAAASSTELAWTARPVGTSARAAHVATTASEGLLPAGEKALRFQNASARFVTEPVDIQNVPFLQAQIKVRTKNTSTVTNFDPVDRLRIYLEVSADGTNFQEPQPPVELVPEKTGELLQFSYAPEFVAQRATLTNTSPNAAGTVWAAVRVVAEAKTDADSEIILLDDLQLISCILDPVVSAVTYLNQGDNVLENDQMQFQLVVNAYGASVGNWEAIGLPEGTLAAGVLGTAATLTVPVPQPSSTPLQFTVQPVGQPECAAVVRIPFPQCAFASISLTPAVRVVGTTPALADDVMGCSLTASGNGATGKQFHIYSTEPQPQLLATGEYGSAVALQVPAAYPSVLLKDAADPLCTAQPLLNLATVTRAMGRLRLAQTETAIYAEPNAVPHFQQASTRPALAATDFGLGRPTASTLELNNSNATSQPLVSQTITLPNQTKPLLLAASLRAWESSNTTGFEFSETTGSDSLRVSLLLTPKDGGTEQAIAIFPPASLDGNINGVLNGFTASTAQPYNNYKQLDEFNLSFSDAAARSRAHFSLRAVIPPLTASLRIRVEATNDSASEYFFIDDLEITEASLDSDADGMPDLWEADYQLDLWMAADAAGDADGDGRSNLAEFLQGTHPRDGTSVFAVSAMSGQILPGCQMELAWSGRNGFTYGVEYSPNLAVGWQELLEVRGVWPMTRATVQLPQGPLGAGNLPKQGFLRVAVKSRDGG